LRLGRSAVDFVCEDNLRHNRPRPKLELHALLVEDAHPRHITGQHVGRKLDAAEDAAHALGQRAREHGLAHAGDIFDQQVPFAQERDERQANFLILANNHGAYIL